MWLFGPFLGAAKKMTLFVIIVCWKNSSEMVSQEDRIEVLTKCV